MLIGLNKSQPRTNLGPQGQRVPLAMASLSWKQIFGIVQRGAITKLARTAAGTMGPQALHPYTLLFSSADTPSDYFLSYTILNPRERLFLFFFIFQVRMLMPWGKYVSISWERKASLDYWWCVCCCLFHQYVGPLCSTQGLEISIIYFDWLSDDENRLK